MLTNTELILGKTDTASIHVADLLRKLDDGITARLPRNQNEWYFHIEPDATAPLLTDAEKLAYIRYVAALTAYLRGRPNEVQKYLGDIAREPAGKESALIVLRADLRRLAGAQPKSAAAITEFAALVNSGR
jgi:hypothetical protein